MLNIEAFLELCRRAAIEKDPAKLANIKEKMRVMVGTDEIQMYQIRWKPIPKPD
jgi:hypothetical protein